MKPSSLALLAVLSLAAACAHGRHGYADPDVTPPETLDLRGSFHDFLRLAQVKQWNMEDKLLGSVRGFADEQRKLIRDLDVKVADDVSSSGEEWRKARSKGKDRRRQAEQEARQKLRILREQTELELIVFERARKVELKDFLASMEAKLDDFKRAQDEVVRRHQGKSNDSLIARAREDVHAAGEDLGQQFTAWSERLKAIKALEEP